MKWEEEEEKEEEEQRIEEKMLKGVSYTYQKYK